MATYLFTGPGTYVFPAFADEVRGGTLTAFPGETYDFGGDPPDPLQWWSAVEPPSSSPAPVKKPVTPAVPVSTTVTPEDTGPATETTSIDEKS